MSKQNDNHRWKMSNTPYQTINRKKEIYSLILNFPLFIFPFPILHFPISHSPFSQNWFPLRKEGFCIWWTVPERTLSRLRVTTKASSYNISELSHFQSDKQTKYKSGNIVWSKIEVSKPELLLKAVGRIYIENFLEWEESGSEKHTLEVVRVNGFSWVLSARYRKTNTNEN